MIVARIEGGLGNQLFQAAFGLQLAKTHGTDLVLDLSSYLSQPAHGMMLDRFTLESVPMDDRVARRIPARHREIQSSRWTDWFAMDSLRRVRERPFGFDESYLNDSPNDSYLVGYWQSERFFPDVRDEVLAQFQPRMPLSKTTESMRHTMANQKSIALHVRRGDYITNPTNASIYKNLSVNYYRDSVEEYLKANERASLYVFSNDIAWCREHLDFRCPIKYVDHTNTQSCHEDMFLMTSAACCVIANSTFSWWGAWLNQRQDKVVYAPNSWFQPGSLNDEHLNASGWRTAGVNAMSQAA